MKTIARGNESTMTCPYPDCGKVNTDMWEVVGGFHDGYALDCDHCGREIELRDVEFACSYRTVESPHHACGCGQGEKMTLAKKNPEPNPAGCGHYGPFYSYDSDRCLACGITAAEKERDEALASVAVLVEAVRETLPRAAWDYSCSEPSAPWFGNTAHGNLVQACGADILGDLPAASLALLREVEALRGASNSLRQIHLVMEEHQLPHATRALSLAVIDNIRITARIGVAALDAVEAGRKG